MEPQWLDWAKRLQAIAQNGLTFAEDPFDVERYEAIRQIAAEMMAAGSGTEIEQIRTLFAQDMGYATPKVDVRAVVFQAEAILLVKERSDGRWTLPGGWADVSASPAENLVREVYEESGFQIRPVKLLAVYDRSKHDHIPPFPQHVYKLFILGEIIGGAASESLETEAVGFFGEDEIPSLSLSRVTPGQIRRMFELYRRPEIPPDLD